MKVSQVATILNAMTTEMLGEDAIQTEDLSNVVEIGQAFTDIFDTTNGVENFVKSLVDHIGRVIIVDRTYRPSGVGLARDSWEYGSILEKIRIDLPEATDNDTWSLTSGTKYDDILVYAPPTVSATFFNKRVTYDIPMSFGEKQVKSAFSSAAELNRFFSGIENRIRTAISFYNDILEKRTLNNLIASKADSRVNLLALYNAEQAAGETITAAEAIHNADFLKFATKTIAQYSDFMAEMSTQFNESGYAAQTPADYQKFVVLSMFARATETYLESDTYHNEFVKLIDHTNIACWQGTKSTNLFDFEAVSTVNAYPTGAVTTGADADDPTIISGVIGVLFDRDAAAVCCEDYRVTSFYNAGNETIKNYYKWDCMYMCDLAENAIVFTIEDDSNDGGDGGNDGGDGGET